MATKWKGWTAKPLVKAMSFFLILLSGVGISVQGYRVLSEIRDPSVLPLLLADCDSKTYFFDRKIRPPVYLVDTLCGYMEGGTIQDGKYTRWPSTEGSALSEDSVSENAAMAQSAYDSVESTEVDQSYTEILMDEQRHIDTLLAELKEYTDQGLKYSIESKGQTLSNVSTAEKDSIKAMPVYASYEGEWHFSEPQRRNYWSESYYDVKAYLGYEQSAINAITQEWRMLQRTLWDRAIPILCLLMITLVSFVVLICGAGRTAGEEPTRENVRFTVWDTLHLDFGLALMLFVQWFVIYVSCYLLIPFLIDYSGPVQSMICISSLMVVVLLMLLCWTVSAAKRVKAGRWWRYTLTSAVTRGLFHAGQLVWRHMDSTLRAIGAACCTLIFGLLCYATNGAFAVLGAIVMLVAAWFFYRRLLRLRRGAEQAAQGRYETPIQVSGGDLGTIADSINNISTGISAAVEQRMKSERMKTELITNVSHDLRTPLTSMITYADLLKSQGLQSEHALEYVDVIIQKTQRLRTLVDELFEAAKASTGNVEVNLSPLNLGDLIRQCLGEMDARVKESGLDFRCRLPEHAPVMGDGRLLCRVIENLLGNVFKYAMSGSRVYIDLEQIQEDYRLEIKNISAHPLNIDPTELTERFTRGDTARNGEGSGLGLSIVQSFVQVQGGRFALCIDGDLFKATVFFPVLAEQRGTEYRPVEMISDQTLGISSESLEIL